MIVWRRLDVPGHEAAELLERDAGWLLAGAAVFAHPAHLSYAIRCDARFQTMAAEVSGRVANEEVRVSIEVNEGRWRLFDVEVPNVEGCIDIDLNFSPSTNLLPIRRLNLQVGQDARVRTAWLRFPSFRLEPLEQVYRRVSEWKYTYESPGFAANLEVDERGMVTTYERFWQVEPPSR
jgi:uncharacterized protein